MSKQFGLIVDNKLSKDGLVSKITMKFPNDEDKKKKANEVADACVDTFADDRCESAYKIWKCVEKKCTEVGLEIM